MKNPHLITNQVKTLLEKINDDALDEEEKVWKQEILWFWNHHAISIAIVKYKDQFAALQFAERALALQSEDHPNKITKLLYLLVKGDLEAAKIHAETVIDDVEGPTARGLIDDYEIHPWF